MKILILLSFVGLFWYFVFSFKKFRENNNDGGGGYDGGTASIENSSYCNASDGGDCGGGDGGD